ncbi:MAG: hypothetical protein ACI4VG_00380 [Lachnospiraceae bacterium]
MGIDLHKETHTAVIIDCHNQKLGEITFPNRPADFPKLVPIFEKNANLTEDEKTIYKILNKTMLKPISEIAPYVPFRKSKTTQLLKEMGQRGVITVEGKGRGTKYIIK